MKNGWVNRLGGLGLACGLALSAGAQAPLTLFNGISLLGWAPHGAWTGTAGVLSTSGTVNRQILTAVPFEDFSLSFDYNESAPMQAKLRLWAPKDGPGGSYVDLDGTGARARVGGVEGSSPSSIASIGDGWHHVQVEATKGRLSVRVDGAQAGTANGGSERAGYLGWEVNGNGTFQVRNVKLVPRGLTVAFNGNDLGSWKNVAHDPASSGGMGHTMMKTLSFGMGGGSTKPHSAKWTVQNGMMHGEDGPGGLEYATPIDDAIVEVTASVQGSIKPDRFTGLGFRDQPGKLGGGYLVGAGPYAGSIDGLTKRAFGQKGGRVQETIVVAGRTTAIWESGNLVTVNTDPRPESDRVSAGAKISGGALTLILPADTSLDVQQISVGVLPKSYGSAVPASPLAIAAGGNGAAGSGAAAVPAGASAAEATLIQQQAATAKQQQDEKEAKQRAAGLMAQALSTTDPQQQMSLYNQVVQIDPSNAPAVQGYKDAQSKLQATAAAQQQAQATQSTEQQNAQTRDQQVNGSIVKAQSAMFAGHLAEASSALMVAERLAPDNPIARDLRNRINATSSLHTRLLYLGGGAGLVGLLALGAAWFRRKRLKRFPMLEQTQGLDAGMQYPIDKDAVKIGAVNQDGGQKNDIVVRDVEHAISRFHCEITRQNGRLYITDLSSRNGTKLEGKPLPSGQPMLLRPGNRILLADSVELRFGYARNTQPKS